MAHILVLGCGYTGKRVARSLLRKGAWVTVTTRHPAGLAELADAGAEVVTMDVLGEMPRLTLAPDTLVLHSIPLVVGPAGLFDPTPLLLNALGGQYARMVYLSTTGVYGAERDVDERTVPAPRTERERLRMHAEQAVMAASPSSLILRPAAIYGPGRGVQVSLPEGRYNLHDGGNNFVSRIHVDDLAVFAEAALFSDRTGAYPVADDEPCTSREIATFCAELLGIVMPSDGAGVMRRSDRRVDGSAILRALGVSLRYPSYRTGIPASLLKAPILNQDRLYRAATKGSGRTTTYNRGVPNPKRVLIVGGGIVGLATALRFLERIPNSSVTVLEKEATAGRHQSGNNSGVLHAGLYYKPGSSKARLTVSGMRQMVEFCRMNNVPHEICGKLVVATAEEELPRLHDLFDRGTRNGLRDLKLMNAAEMREIEPNVAGIAAIRVPEEGIVDYGQVCTAMVRRIEEGANGRVVMNAEVRGLRRTSRGWIATSSVGEYEADLLINCAGLQCDRIAQMAGLKREARIVPFRGEYYKLRPERESLVRHLIYPVPDPKFPFLGVHFTRMIRGGVECGPNAVLAFAREGYRKTDFNAVDLTDALTYPGLWRFLRKYPKMCFAELRRSFSKELFCRSLQRLVPDVQVRDLAPGGAGVRAQALTKEGGLVQDFLFQKQARAVHLLNAPSPGATASLAIGEEIVTQALETV